MDSSNAVASDRLRHNNGVMEKSDVPRQRRSGFQWMLRSFLFIGMFVALKQLWFSLSFDHTVDEIRAMRETAATLPLQLIHFNKEASHVLVLKRQYGVHSLRYNWNDMPLNSDLAKRMLKHQSNCSLPLGNFGFRNRFGLGSDLHVWGQALCNGMERNIRMRSIYPWTWLDEKECDLQAANHSSMLCYFPKSELLCKDDMASTASDGNIRHWLSRPKRHSVNISCDTILQEYDIPQVRAAAAEYLFQSVSPVVVKEAERQLQLVFPNGVPDKLIAVHIRWGDKKREMKLVTIEGYIEGVQSILDGRGESDVRTTPSIYLASEDPKAVLEFKAKAPSDWNIYVDQYYVDMLEFREKEDVYNQGPKTSKETKGRAGLVALGSLLVAMEADDFVLTTASNWSRLMNELRKNVLDPLCDGCTNVVDLRYGEW